MLAGSVSLQNMSQTTITVVGPEGKSSTVSWFSGASEESILSSITDALGLPAEEQLELRDGEGDIVAVSEDLPSSLVVHVNLLSTTSARVREHVKSSGMKFRGQVLKFERVQAHLANERTWLAWVRTALSALSVAFSLLTLSDSASSSWLEVALFVSGCAMTANVLLTFITGWLRYVRVKDVLLLAKEHMTEDFRRFGLSHHARFLSVILCFISVLYLLGSSQVE